MNPFIPNPCSRCGATVWIATSTGVGHCPQCQTPAWIPPGSHPGVAAPPYPAPGVQPPATAPVAPRRRGLTVALLLTLLGVVALVCVVKIMRHGRRSLNEVGVTERAADPAVMIRASGELAREWRSDAVFRSILIHGMRTDGTVDLSNPENVVYVVYFSPSLAASAVAGERDDSGRQFTFRSSGLNYVPCPWAMMFSPNETPSYTETRVPGCSTPRLGASLASQGATPTAEFEVTFGPDMLSYEGSGALDWKVSSMNPSIERWYDANTCAFLRGR